MYALRLLRTASRAPLRSLQVPKTVVAPRRVAPVITPIRFYSGPAPLTKEFVLERVTGVLSNCDKIRPEQITPSARLEEDLGLDSLDVVDALFFVEEEFTVQMPDHEADGLKTVQDVVDWVYNQKDAV